VVLEVVHHLLVKEVVEEIRMVGDNNIREVVVVAVEEVAMVVHHHLG
jgi:hypothetical protein